MADKVHPEFEKDFVAVQELKEILDANEGRTGDFPGHDDWFNACRTFANSARVFAMKEKLGNHDLRDMKRRSGPWSSTSTAVTCS